MRRTVWIPVLLAVVLLPGCSEKPPTSTGAVVPHSASDNFYQVWVHSHEEDPGDPGVQVYRPSGSREFPASWFREIYEFNADGTGARLVLHPADAHYMEAVTWERDSRNPGEVVIVNPDGIEVVRFRILQLTPDLMRIEPI